MQTSRRGFFGKLAGLLGVAAVSPKLLNDSASGGCKTGTALANCDLVSFDEEGFTIPYDFSDCTHRCSGVGFEPDVILFTTKTYEPQEAVRLARG